MPFNTKQELNRSLASDSRENHPRIGTNSTMIKEISDGPIFANEVELIELKVDTPGVLENNAVNYTFLDGLNSLGNKFSVHGPYADYGNDVKNLEIMEKVLSVAHYLNADFVSLHGRIVAHDYRDALLKTVTVLKQYCRIAARYPITLLFENMVREKNNDRIGVLPVEVLQVINLVNEENLKFCFDVGHANLAAHVYGFDILDFVTILSSYLREMHIHDNSGVPANINEKFGDQHLAPGNGQIDFIRIFQAIDKSTVKNLVLELFPSSTTRMDALKSISTLKEIMATL